MDFNYANKYVNKFELTGRVVAIREDHYGNKMVTIFTKNGKDVYLKVRMDKEVYAAIDGTNHAIVSITGHIVNKRVPSRVEKNKYILAQQFVADIVSPEKTLTDQYFGVKGKFHLPLSIKIYICGILASSNVNDKGWTRYVVDTFNDKNKKTSIVTYLGKVDRRPKVNNGDMVCMVCSLSTPKKEVNGKAINYEDIIVSDIAKA